MSDITKKVYFPLDEEGFFRRQCPLCRREFKVLLKQDELINLSEEAVNTYLIESEEERMESVDDGTEQIESVCPYCGQRAPRNSWLTQEQRAYVRVIGHNILAKLVNEQLIRPMKRAFPKRSSGLISIHFEGKEMEQHEPCISPETNDMEVFDLPCCERRIKILDSWDRVVHCFLCGFPHRGQKPTQ